MEETLFTGIIEEVGRVHEIRAGTCGARVSIQARTIMPGLKPGDSIAVNGVCLTAVEISAELFSCDLSSETLERSTLGRLVRGTAINLERALAANSRLGGHFVLGHVDGVGSVSSLQPSGEGLMLTVSFPAPLFRYLVFKGSIAVDGISLTIATLTETTFGVAVIPHTLNATNLGILRHGDAVNLETDVLGKYVERLLTTGEIQASSPVWNESYLRDQGY